MNNRKKYTLGLIIFLIILVITSCSGNQSEKVDIKNKKKIEDTQTQEDKDQDKKEKDISTEENKENLAKKEEEEKLAKFRKEIAKFKDYNGIWYSDDFHRNTLNEAAMKDSGIMVRINITDSPKNNKISFLVNGLYTYIDYKIKEFPLVLEDDQLLIELKNGVYGELITNGDKLIIRMDKDYFYRDFQDLNGENTFYRTYKIEKESKDHIGIYGLILDNLENYSDKNYVKIDDKEEMDTYFYSPNFKNYFVQKQVLSDFFGDVIDDPGYRFKLNNIRDFNYSSQIEWINNEVCILEKGDYHPYPYIYNIINGSMEELPIKDGSIIDWDYNESLNQIIFLIDHNKKYEIKLYDVENKTEKVLVSEINKINRVVWGEADNIYFSIESFDSYKIMNYDLASGKETEFLSDKRLYYASPDNKYLFFYDEKIDKKVIFSLIDDSKIELPDYSELVWREDSKQFAYSTKDHNYINVVSLDNGQVSKKKIDVSELNRNKNMVKNLQYIENYLLFDVVKYDNYDNIDKVKTYLVREPNVVSSIFGKLNVDSVDYQIIEKALAVYFSEIEQDFEGAPFMTVEETLDNISTEGGILTGYYVKDELKKIEAKVFGEMGKAYYNYYFVRPSFIYLEKTYISYDKPMFMDGSKVDEEKISKYVLIDNTVFQLDEDTKGLIKVEESSYSEILSDYESRLSTEYVENNPVKKDRGNSSGNIVNGGHVAPYGDWIYYGLPLNDIYKMRKDGTNITLLTSDGGYYLNVLDGWVYYTNVRNGYIYKISTDGKIKIRLVNDKSSYLNVVDDWIYYVNRSDNNTIYKVKVDGTEKTKLNDTAKSESMIVKDNWIYYLWNKKIYKIRIDGTDNMKLSEYNVEEFDLSGIWIYFTNSDDYNYLYRMKTDGTNGEKLNNIYSYVINVSGDWVYYNNSRKEKLYRLKLDGTINEEVLSEKFYYTNLQITDDWFFYGKGVWGTDAFIGYFKIKTDGTNETKF